MTIVRWHASLLVTAGSRAVSGKLLQQPGVQVSMPQTQLCVPHRAVGNYGGESCIGQEEKKQDHAAECVPMFD